MGIRTSLAAGYCADVDRGGSEEGITGELELQDVGEEGYERVVRRMAKVGVAAMARMTLRLQS